MLICLFKFIKKQQLKVSVVEECSLSIKNQKEHLYKEGTKKTAI